MHRKYPPAPGFSALVAVFLVLVLVLCQVRTAEAGLPVKAALMMNLSSGRILYQKNADRAIPPASLTKIMTSFLVHDAVSRGRISMQTKVRVSSQASRVGGSTMNLRTGERVTVAKLLQGTIICSGNDAATALALRVGGSQAAFVRTMNAKAAQLGMRSTVFKNPTGLPAAGQATTARDLMRLCRAYLARYPGAMDIHSQHFFHHRERQIATTNPFLGSRGVDGLKTGFTLASGYNIILTAGKGKNRLLIIVLGGRSRAQRDMAASALLEAGIKHPANARLVREQIDGKESRQIATTKKTVKQRKQIVAKRKVVPRKSSREANVKKATVRKKAPAKVKSQKKVKNRKQATERNRAKARGKSQKRDDSRKKR